MSAQCGGSQRIPGAASATPASATPAGASHELRAAPRNLRRRREPQPASGSAIRFATGAPVKVWPVVPVISTCMYEPISDLSPGTRIVR